MKKVEKEINDLHALVSNLDPSESGDHGYIEIVEVPPLGTSTPTPEMAAKLWAKPSATAKSAPNTTLPPPIKPVGIFERAFSFSGVTDRRLFFWTFLGLQIAVAVVYLLGEAGVVAEGWALIALAIVLWSLLANIVKRWRDTGNNMWWLITLLIPYIAFITTLAILFAPSKRNP